MERIAISSFLHHGHQFHLYTYGPVAGVPQGTTLLDAAQILPASSIFRYSSGFGAGSPAVFSDVFRYQLLLERGGWWVDTDVICLRPFDFQQDSVLGLEHLEPGSDSLIVSTSVIKQPAGSPLMRWASKQCSEVARENIAWGQVGPRLLQRGVEAFGLQATTEKPACFSPIPYFEWRRFLEPAASLCVGSDTYGVHLWHQMWSHNSVDTDGSFPSDCLYSQWRNQYLLP